MWTDDPVADAERYTMQQEAAWERLPVCADCGERVHDDYFYLINDEVICPDCLEAGYRKDIDEYIE